MNTISYLKENYGYGVPIFLKDLRIGHKSKTAIKQDLYRAVKRGDIKRYSSGVYELNDKNENLLEQTKLSIIDVIEDKYIKPSYSNNIMSDLNIYGYYSGLTFLNMIGISQQVPAIREITTNKTSSKKRVAKIGNWFVIIRRPKTEITFQNFKILQFLDMFHWLTIDDIKENKKIIINYIRTNFTKYSLNKYLRLYDTRTINLLIEGGLINEFK